MDGSTPGYKRHSRRGLFAVVRPVPYHRRRSATTRTVPRRRITMPLAKAQPGTTRVGFIGTGVMGQSMCRNIMTAGYATTVYSRTKAKSQPLLDAGAAWADNPQAVAERSDVVFAIVGFPSDVREVFLAPRGALAGAKAGSVLVDMTA